MESDRSISGDSSSDCGSSESSSESEEEERIEPVRVLGQTLELPHDLCENASIFKDFFSIDTWNSLNESQTEHLKKFLPTFPVNDDEEKEKTVKALLGRKRFKFTSPLMDFHDNLKLGNYRPDIAKMKKYLQKTQEKQNKKKMKKYYAHLMLDLVIERERLLSAAKGLPPGPLPRLPPLKQSEKKAVLSPHERTKIRYFKELAAIQGEVNAPNTISEDENYPEEVAFLKGNKQLKLSPMQSAPSFGSTLLPLTADNLKPMLAKHRARRNRRENHPELNTAGITLEDIKHRVGLYNGMASKTSIKLKRKRQETIKRRISEAKQPIKAEPVDDQLEKFDPVKVKSEKESDTDTLIDPTGSPTPAKRAKSCSTDKIDIKQEAIDPGSSAPSNQEELEDPPGSEEKEDLEKSEGSFNQSVPIKLEDLDGIDMMSLPVELVEEQPPDESCLETETHASFFSLVRALFPPSQAHRADILYLRRKLAATLRSPIAPLNSWYNLSNDWSSELDSALAFLAGEKGPHPEDYVPYLQYITESQMYQWIGAGRDCDALLGRLCERWLRSKRSPQKPDVAPPVPEHQSPTPPKEQKKPTITQKEPSRLKKSFQKLQKEFKKQITHKESAKKKVQKDKEDATPIPAHWEEALNSFKIKKKDEKIDIAFSSYLEDSPFSVNTKLDLAPNFTTIKKDVSSSDSGTDVRIPIVKTKIVPGKPQKSKPSPKTPVVKSSSRKPSKEVQEFRESERCRYSQPDAPYTYITKFGYVVVPPLQFGCLSTLDTRNWESVLESELSAKLVVCDALARTQPKGATQHQLLMLVKMSQFVKKVPDQNLMQYILHILDQMKMDVNCPIVKHDTKTKLWTYLLRDKSEHDYLTPAKALSVERETEHMEVGCVEEVVDNNASSDSEVDVENTSESSPPILRPDEQKAKMTFVRSENLFVESEEANQEYARSSEAEVIQRNEQFITTHDVPQKDAIIHQVIRKQNIIGRPASPSQRNQIINKQRSESPQTQRTSAKQIILQQMPMQSHQIINRQQNYDQSKLIQTSKMVTQPQFVQSPVQQMVQTTGQRVLKVVQTTQPAGQTQSLLHSSQYIGRQPIIIATPKNKNAPNTSTHIIQTKNAVKIPILHSINSQIMHTEQFTKEKSPNRQAGDINVQRNQHQINISSNQSKKIMPAQQVLIKTAGQSQKLQQLSLQGQKILQKAKQPVTGGQQIFKQGQQTLKTVTIQKPNQSMNTGNQLILTSMGGQKILQTTTAGQQLVGKQIIQTQSTTGQPTIQLPQVIQGTHTANQVQGKTQATRSLLLRSSTPGSGDTSTLTSVISSAQGRRGVVRVLSAATPTTGKSLISPRALMQQGNQSGIRKHAPVTPNQASTNTVFSTTSSLETRPKTVQLLQTSGPRRTIQLAGQSVQLSSGQTVQIAAQNVQLPSGQTVQLASGHNLQALQLGQNVQLAGQTVQFGGQSVQLTGQTVQIAGQNVQLTGQSLQLGGQRLQLGGQTVQLASGQSLQLSGQTVQLASGQSVQLAAPMRTSHASGGVQTAQPIMTKFLTNQAQLQLASAMANKSQMVKNETTSIVTSSSSGAANKQLLLTHKNLVLQPGEGQHHALLLSSLGGSPQIVRTTTSSSSPVIKLQQAASGGNMVTLTSPQLKLLGAPGHILARILPSTPQNKPPSSEPS